MAEIKLTATAAFGLEAVVRREIEQLGYAVTEAADGRLTFAGDERALVRADLWLRSADRVYVQMGEFPAASFDALFEGTRSLPWEDWIPRDGRFTVVGTSVRSMLHSVPDCQAIVKKAVASRLGAHYRLEWLPETGAEYTIRFQLQKDRALLLIDASGEGLHKRGYRVANVTAPIKETLAAAMVQLSFFRPGRFLVDPFCGSGTIAIEAALIAKNIAPGLSRSFAAQAWERIPASLWKEEKTAAFAAIRDAEGSAIFAADIDKRAVAAARENAIEAGVDDLVRFRIQPLSALQAEREGGVIVTNPPYGMRIGEQNELAKLYRFLGAFCRSNPTWSLFAISADKNFERAFGRPADRRRKLYNGQIETCYYQFHSKEKAR